tara:strand:- start:873 stop:1709 length:837 start_codon:yes stop_codon:yes gene_type:complete
MYKVFTFFYNRFTDATTSLALKENGIEHNVLIHKEEDLDKFIKGKTIAGNPIITNKPKGLAYQRNAALELMEEGEWAVFMCDDFKDIRSYPINDIMNVNKKINVNFENQQEHTLRQDKFKMNLSEMFTMFPRLIELAEKNKIHLVGFGLHDNPLNLGRKFATRGLADGRFWLVKKSKYKFDENVQMVDDVCWTAENLIRHNNVLILNWTVPYFKRYTAGAFGSISERKQQRLRECKYLANKFNPLIKIAHKANWDYGTHVRIYGSNNNIRKARINNGL